MEIDPTLQWLLAASIVIYLVAMYALAVVAQGKIHNVEDFLVAGRQLPLSLAWMTLLATWFGAGTMLTAADEVRAGGLTQAALDPFGAGCCLMLAGLFVAGPMWRQHLLTVPDLFRKKFGPTAELFSALILVPSYFGWIAAQFVAMAQVLDLFFGIPLYWGIALVALVGTGYTLMGGMWSVTMTDAAQVVLLLVGLIVLVIITMVELGNGNAWNGLTRIMDGTEPQKLVVIPRDDLQSLVGWLGVFAIGALGNLPGQDLMQRVFASKSEGTARYACLIAGAMYLTFGCLPLLLALAATQLVPEESDGSVLPVLAHAFLHPFVAVVFMVALMSAILSTIDSAILSPASVLSQNIIPRFASTSSLSSNRLAIMLVALSSLLLAYLGESAYALLEESYLLTLVGLLVPMMIGLYSISNREAPAIVSMTVGAGVWATHFVCGWESFLEPVLQPTGWQLPISLSVTACALIAFFVISPPWKIHWQREEGKGVSTSDTFSFRESRVS
ncbi:MAG: sodium:solute symporter family protein [Planctomycetales bacterium]|nr:sodium:solute symporter family protein [Planctomycetales bacterium]